MFDEDIYLYLKDHLKHIINDFQSMFQEVTILIKLVLTSSAKNLTKSILSNSAESK